MFKEEQQKVLIMLVFSCIDLVIITDFINPVTKPDKQMSSSITYNVGGISTCQENVTFSIIKFLFIISFSCLYAYYIYV